VDDFRQLTRRDVSKIAKLLNERPGKIPDFKTPYEAFLELHWELPNTKPKTNPLYYNNLH
jgi:IS30 family transposase